MRALRPYAEMMRGICCEPKTLELPESALRSRFSLPAQARLQFRRDPSVRIGLPEGLVVGDLAAGLGIAAPVAHVAPGPGVPTLTLGSNPQTGALDRFAPCRISIALQIEPDADASRVAPAALEQEVEASATLFFASGAVEIAPDPDAVPLLWSALERVAADPTFFDPTRGEAAARVGLPGNRFRVEFAATWPTDGVAIYGVRIEPVRTRVPARALVATLGLDGAGVGVARGGAVPVLTPAGVMGGTQALRWKGLWLKVNVSGPDPSKPPSSLDTAEVASIWVTRV